ncbi:MAG: hypothetical protein KA369_02905 [Spirochaetes bacterium]|nr:hypothetical protein [Spirochaetota bacterium]
MNKCPAIFLLLFIMFPVYPAGAETDNDKPVTIQILSKQVRLLKSGAIKRISISVTHGATVRDENHRVIDGKTISCSVTAGMVGLFIDDRPLAGSGKLDIAPAPEKDDIVIHIDGEARRYPLPLSVRFGDNSLIFTVQENLNRYVVDSSLAEYSGDYWKEREGILALAQVIRARYHFSKKNPRHGNADFCDLTHCQVYRGRMNSAISFHDDWVIDHQKLRHNLFFHSRCGGRTFDPGVFRGKAISAGNNSPGVRDWLYRKGTRLCSAKDSRWERTIGNDELAGILFPGKVNDGNASLSLRYDRDIMVVEVITPSGKTSFPVETFRLKINRVKGWNFIRSNSFTVSEKTTDNERLFLFRGEGLGHGTGLCQHGAMALSRLGYNRYEILEHYFPDLQFQSPETEGELSPYCSYCLFDVSTGKVLKSTQGEAFLSRTVPPGSLFKVIVALYLAAERPDIFSDYAYPCTGRNVNDPNLPDRCWRPKGHGTVRLKEALPNSCNLYFSSLYKNISQKKFRAFYQNFCGSLGIRQPLPETANDRQWAELLAGLDFRMSFTIGDLIKLARYCYCGNGEVRDQSVPGIPVPYQERLKLFQGLRDTFAHGTASEQKKRSGPSCNYISLENPSEKKSNMPLTGLWGKTATVLDGTNTPLSYGLFMGGNGATGVIVVLRKGTGNMASRWARKILGQEKRND